MNFGSTGRLSFPWEGWCASPPGHKEPISRRSSAVRASFGPPVLRLSNCRTNPGLGITKRSESVVSQHVRCDARLRGQVTWVLRCVAIVGMVYENSSKEKVWCRSQRVPSTALSPGVRLPTAQNVRGHNTRRRRASSQEVQGPFGSITTVTALIQASFSAPLP